MKKIKLKSKLKKNITFYCENEVERQLITPLFNIFNENKYKVKITNNLNESSEIGYYCCPSNSIKNLKTNFSIISLGGMDQGKLFWPNFWYKEPWDKFDLGILPGKNWGKMWLSSSWYKCANPKFGIIIGGWPKTQGLKRNKIFKINEKKKFNILYAPCFENDGKGNDVINAVKDLNVNLMIKYLPWNAPHEKSRFKFIRNNNASIIKSLRNNFRGDFKIYNSKINIFNIFNNADLLITDESSLMFETLLFDVPSLSCADWKVRSSNLTEPRYVKQNRDICNYTSRSNLKSKIEDIILNYKEYHQSVLDKKKEHFSHINDSATNIFKIINLLVEKNELENIHETNYKISYTRSIILNIKRYINTIFS